MNNKLRQKQSMSKHTFTERKMDRKQYTLTEKKNS